MQPDIMPILAEAGGDGFSFSGFQKTFHEAWDFVVPNAIILLLCLLTAKFVGRQELRWLRVRLDKVRNLLRELSKFLNETGLFGSKLLPAIVAIAIVIATFDVFELLRNAASDLIPPRIVCSPYDLYARLADDDMLIRLFVHQGGFAYEYKLYEEVNRWEERMQNDSKLEGAERLKYWDECNGDWNRRASDVKFLALVAVLSCVIALFQRKWGSFFRMLAVLALLGIVFTFCLAKVLYAHEQRAHSVLSALDQHLREQDNEDVRGLLRKRTDEMDWSSRWLTEKREVPRPLWWKLELFDEYFFKRLRWLFGAENQDRLRRPPLLTKEELDWLKVKWEMRGLSGTNSSTAKAPVNNPVSKPQ